MAGEIHESRGGSESEMDGAMPSTASRTVGVALDSRLS